MVRRCGKKRRGRRTGRPGDPRAAPVRPPLPRGGPGRRRRAVRAREPVRNAPAGSRPHRGGGRGRRRLEPALSVDPAARRALLAPVPGHIRRRRCVGLRSLPGQAGAGRPGTAGRLARVDLPDRVVHGRCDSVPGGRACRGRRDVGGVRHVRRRNRGVAGAHGVGRRVSRWRGLDAGGGRPRPVPLGAAAARGPRGGPPDAGAVRRGARRCDRRRSPCGPARALGHRARHLGEHAPHDRSGCCARHRGMAARPGAPRHRPAGRRARRAAGRGRRRGRAGTRAGRRGLRGTRARGGRLPGGGGGAARGRPGPGRGRGRGPGERRAARGRRVCARGRAAGATGLEVVVADNGAGFRPDRVGPHRFGLALSVHDRMASAGGCATVESAPGRGTVVRLRWPA